MAAVEDVWLGEETRDAPRFCRAIVGRIGERFVRVNLRACEADFREGGFDDFREGERLVRVLSVSRRGKAATVRLSLQKGTHSIRSVQRMVFAFGRWRLALDAPQ